jgi:rhodanese-related sulfurtransferase
MYKNIIASDLKGLIGKVNIIDIRKNYLYNVGSIPSSKNIPKDFLLMNPEKYLNKEEKYYIYCSGGMESPKVCSELSKKGYKVVNVLGGYNDYLIG